MRIERCIDGEGLLTNKLKHYSSIDKFICPRLIKHITVIVLKANRHLFNTPKKYNKSIEFEDLQNCIKYAKAQ